jgi:hypothetical protein
MNATEGSPVGNGVAGASLLAGAAPGAPRFTRDASAGLKGQGSDRTRGVGGPHWALCGKRGSGPTFFGAAETRSAMRSVASW